MKNYNDIMTDEAVHDLARKVAGKEFKEHSSVYSCELEDLAGELFYYYMVSLKPRLDGMVVKAYEADMTLERYLINALTFEVGHIRQRELRYSRRFKIESDLFDGEFQPNTYFRMLEDNGGFSLWNDNEKVIDTWAIKTPSKSRPLSTPSDFSNLDKAEAQRIMEENLTQEELKLVALYLESKTEREIAATLGITQQAVHKRIQKIFSKLQNKG